MNRNEDFITQEVDRPLEYTIYIEPDLRSLKEQSSDILDIISNIFESFAPVFVPTSYRSHVDFVDSIDIHETTHSHIIDEKELEIDDLTGICMNDINNVYSNDHNQACRIIRQFKLDGDANVFLQDGSVRVGESKNSDRYKKRHRGEIVGKPDRPVFSFDFRYRGLAEQQDDPYYVLDVFSRSDLWIQNTTIGQINRARLSSCFQQFLESLDVLQVECPPQYYKEKLVRSVLDYDGPPADELIEAYQRQDEDT